MSHLGRTAIAAALLALALRGAAGATDYCVAPNDDCGGTNVDTFEEALDLAQDDANLDRIFLGGALYKSTQIPGFAYSRKDAPWRSSAPGAIARSSPPRPGQRLEPAGRRRTRELGPRPEDQDPPAGQGPVLGTPDHGAREAGGHRRGPGPAPGEHPRRGHAVRERDVRGLHREARRAGPHVRHGARQRHGAGIVRSAPGLGSTATDTPRSSARASQESTHGLVALGSLTTLDESLVEMTGRRAPRSGRRRPTETTRPWSGTASR